MHFVFVVCRTGKYVVRTYKTLMCMKLHNHITCYNLFAITQKVITVTHMYATCLHHTFTCVIKHLSPLHLFSLL